jgi:hypothetical protein
LGTRCYANNLYNNKKQLSAYQKRYFSSASQAPQEASNEELQGTKISEDANTIKWQRTLQFLRNRLERRKQFPFTFCDVLESDIELDYSYPQELEEQYGWDFDQEDIWKEELFMPIKEIKYRSKLEYLQQRYIR